MVDVVDVEKTELDAVEVVGEDSLVTAAFTCDLLEAIILYGCRVTMCVDVVMVEALKLCADVRPEVLLDVFNQLW
jgi:hypothetical protein